MTCKFKLKCMLKNQRVGNRSVVDRLIFVSFKLARFRKD